ncbi:MAG: NUDIX hydrolase [Chitinophagaceae bacterium]
MKPTSMDKLTWQILSSEYLNKHVYFTARRDRCLRQDGVIVDPYFVVELPTAATAFALTENNEVLLVKQYRHPIGEVALETPGGFVDEGEDFTTAMKRELLEETGYEFISVEYLGKFAANPGILNNYTEMFMATGGRKTAEQKLDHSEELEIVLVSIEESAQLLMQQKIRQSVHANCIFFSLLKLGKLQFV